MHQNWRRRALDSFGSYAMTSQSRHWYHEAYQWLHGAGLTEIEHRDFSVAMKGQSPMPR